jgi:hypothetical protein
MSTADKNKLAYIGAKPGTNRDSDSWYTPTEFLARTRHFLGCTTAGIDFDPFSSAAANDRPGGVHAHQFFTKEDDAITTPWPIVQTVFMNPPYGRGVIHGAIQAFVQALEAGRFERGLVLVNNATETVWYKDLRTTPAVVAICNPFGRIAFESFDGKAVSGNTRGQSILMFDVGDRRAAQRRAREAFEGQPGRRGKILFPFMGFVDAQDARRTQGRAAR